MKIYFGLANASEVNEFGTDGLLEHSGDYYSGVVEFGSNPGGIEDVMISDGCGRQIPISVEDLFGLCNALSECANIHSEIAQAEELKDYVESRYNEASVCGEGHVHY